MSPPSPLLASLCSLVAIWLRALAWLVDSAAAALVSLCDEPSSKARALPTVYVTVTVLNRAEKLAEMEGAVKADVAQKVVALGPLAALAADLAGKAAAGLAAAAVSDTDLGVSVGQVVTTALPSLLQPAGIRCDARVVYAEGALAVVRCHMLHVDLRELCAAIASRPGIGLSVGRLWGLCWDAFELVGLGGYFERATEARVGELAALSLTALLPAEVERAVHEEMGGLAVAVTALPAERQAEHFFDARQQLGMGVTPR